LKAPQSEAEQGRVIQAKRTGANDPAERQADELGEQIGRSLRGAGGLTAGELQGPAQRAAEGHLGVPMSGVKLHASSGAQAKVAEHQALAVTEGSDVSFGAGNLETATEAGRSLVGHELVHVAQQRASGTRASQRKAPPGDAAKKEKTTPASRYAAILGALEKGDTAEAFKLLNGLSMAEMLRVLTRLPGGSFASIAAQQPPGAVDTTRVGSAVRAVQLVGDLASTGESDMNIALVESASSYVTMLPDSTKAVVVRFWRAAGISSELLKQLYEPKELITARKRFKSANQSVLGSNVDRVAVGLVLVAGDIQAVQVSLLDHYASNPLVVSSDVDKQHLATTIGPRTKLNPTALGLSASELAAVLLHELVHSGQPTPPLADTGLEGVAYATESWALSRTRPGKGTDAATRKRARTDDIDDIVRTLYSRETKATMRIYRLMFDQLSAVAQGGPAPLADSVPRLARLTQSEAREYIKILIASAPQPPGLRALYNDLKNHAGTEIYIDPVKLPPPSW